MTLGREVPREIARGVGPFVERLLARLDVAGEASDSRTPCFYAVHPGGPKIVDAVEETLGLSTEQTLHSREILRSRGNLSSATLPHIWDALLKEREIPHGARVVSLAFGPGLTLCGSVFRVHRKGDPRTNRERVL
jgi:predicted naringenin-chalcone synthase